MAGPWSDLPPPPPPKRGFQPSWRSGRRQGSREPFINNWRGLLVVAFLVLIAPVLVRLAVQTIQAMVTGG